MGDQSKFDMINTRLHFVLKGSHAPSYCSRPTFRHTNSAATQKKTGIINHLFRYSYLFIINDLQLEATRAATSHCHMSQLWRSRFLYSPLWKTYRTVSVFGISLSFSFNILSLTLISIMCFSHHFSVEISFFKIYRPKMNDTKATCRVFFFNAMY